MARPRKQLPVTNEIRRGRRTVRLSNLDKPYWPEEGITKGDLLRYYRDVAPTLLPHLRDRPFTMKRYPDGWAGRPFFRRDATNYVPPWVKRVDARVMGGPGRADDRGAGRERRAGLALDGQHGLHRVPHLVLAHGQARSTRLGRVRPRSLRRRWLPRDGRGRAARQEGARRVRARLLPQDIRRARPARARARSNGGTPTTTRGRSRPASPAGSPTRIPTSRRPSGRKRSAAAC